MKRRTFLRILGAMAAATLIPPARRQAPENAILLPDSWGSDYGKVTGTGKFSERGIQTMRFEKEVKFLIGEGALVEFKESVVVV